MERLEQIIESVNKPSKGKTGKKRKWREIEALKDRHRLKRELEDIDSFNEYELDKLGF